MDCFVARASRNDGGRGSRLGQAKLPFLGIAQEYSPWIFAAGANRGFRALIDGRSREPRLSGNGGAHTSQDFPAHSPARNAMPDLSRIVLDPKILDGKPVVRGTRLSIEFVVGLLAEGWSEADILENYPNLGVEDVRACLAYALDALASEKVYPSAA
jgi:uncharacterized protein (DUF433 family)